MNQQQITIHEPSRAELRLVFELALRGCETDGARDSVMRVAAWHELLWQARDRQEQEAKQNPTASRGGDVS